ncbi:ergothioneine biosynthesis protein EgtB [Bacteroidota bacterium]
MNNNTPVTERISVISFEHFKKVRQRSLKICNPLKIEDYVAQPVVDVSPPKWHLGHTTWFFEEFVLDKFVKGYKRFHPRFAYMFNSYYEAVGDRVIRPNRGNMTRPTVDEVLEYRQFVDSEMEKNFERLPDEVFDFIELGLHHEQQHQELLLTDIKYILGHNPLFPVYDDNFVEWNGKIQDGYIEMEGGIYQIGHTGNDFAYDNEGKSHNVQLNDFEISRSLVTNKAYLEFLEDESYHRTEWWHSDAWAWINETGMDRPMYWHNIDGYWMKYAMKGLELLPLSEPVTHISFYEAAAFAEWKGMRLPTEFEWEAACNQFEWGYRWEYTASAYLPYPGFEKPEGAVGEYNGKFMVNQMVLRGASIATSPGHARFTYRNFFHPHLQWQFNGIRLCRK